jgi:hypothetical protein
MIGYERSIFSISPPDISVTLLNIYISDSGPSNVNRFTMIPF